MKNFTKPRTVALGTLGVMTAAMLGGPMTAPAHADADTWKKVAIGAGAVTAYGLVKGKGKVAAIGGLATVGSYLKYRSDKKKEKREAAWYRQRYGRNWQRHYR